MFFIERMKEYGLGMVGLNLATWAVWRRCPLSEWQAQLLKKFHPPAAFDGAFISHYAKKYVSINLSRATWGKIIYVYMVAIVIVALML